MKVTVNVGLIGNAKVAVSRNQQIRKLVRCARMCFWVKGKTLGILAIPIFM